MNPDLQTIKNLAAPKREYDPADYCHNHLRSVWRMIAQMADDFHRYNGTHGCCGKINAIKLLRVMHPGMGLKTAKNMVEAETFTKMYTTFQSAGMYIPDYDATAIEPFNRFSEK